MMKLLSALFLLFLIFSHAHAVDYAKDDEELPFVSIQALKDFSTLSEEVRTHNKIIMLEVSASYCDYCYLLEEEIIKPMLRSGDYTDTVVIRQLEMDADDPLTDFSGVRTTHANIAKKYNIFLTPTLLFLDSQGNEVAPRILGVNSLDYFGSYVDEALLIGLSKIRKYKTPADIPPFN